MKTVASVLGILVCLHTRSAHGETLVNDNFNDGNFTSGTTWTIGESSGGTWSVNGTSLELHHPSLLNTFNYHPVPHYIETTFADGVATTLFARAGDGWQAISIQNTPSGHAPASPRPGAT